MNFFLPKKCLEDPKINTFEQFRTLSNENIKMLQTTAQNKFFENHDFELYLKEVEKNEFKENTVTLKNLLGIKGDDNQKTVKKENLVNEIKKLI